MDILVLERSLEEGVEEMEAGLVGCEEGSFDAYSTEGSRADPSVRVSAERAAPGFQFIGLAGCVLSEQLHRRLFGEELAPFARAVRMRVPPLVFAGALR